ncbi:hypothetical protein QLQ12_42895 [Actinoplanes sp. NEAU-A12]|uniref:DUF8094 domain-containing protein n=1 Tax=Actinoplanes sandaracinus TaxID=3045177 RepID=A0ABT6X0I9_9ACTN|nr:hypothetical protein [Actinoplanes sandaracinus]MDI6105350.1 hypothetical protein [Actinoplanes sandaracinus]
MAIPAAFFLAVAGCAGPATEPAASRPEAAQASAAGFDPAAVLAEFDQGDSAASKSGDGEKLAVWETGPALQNSLAAVKRARLSQRVSPGFRHQDPVFAVADPADCFVAAAKLAVDSEDRPRADVSHFVRADGGRWQLSHHVMVADPLMAAAGIFTRATGRPTGEMLDAARRTALTGEVFTRSIGGPADTTVLARSAVLDDQLAAGWSIYTQQMEGAGMKVDRRLTASEWAPCAAKADDGIVAFLTLNVVDTIVSTKDGADAVLAPPAPDLLATGRTEAVRAHTITVSRVEVFLLKVPPSGAPATVAGLTDAATEITATD